MGAKVPGPICDLTCQGVLAAGGIIGVAVAVPVGACLIGAGVGLLVWRRNKHRLVARLSGQQSTASAKNRAGSYWNGTSPKLQTSGSSSEASQEPWEFNENGLVARYGVHVLCHPGQHVSACTEML